MTLAQLKKETNHILDDLPKNADWEDLMYQIYVRQKVKAGLRDSNAGRVVTSSQIRKKLKLKA